LAAPDLEAGAAAVVAALVDLQRRNPSLRIRELDLMRRRLTAPGEHAVENANNLPGAILTINVTGGLTTFSPELLGQTHERYGTFCWGSVQTHDWSALSTSDGFQRAHDDIVAGVELCRQQCGYFAVCGGGSPSNKLAEHGTFVAAEALYCRLHVQHVADAIGPRWGRDGGS
jgi:uncharacterized protein